MAMLEGGQILRPLVPKTQPAVTRHLQNNPQCSGQHTSARPQPDMSRTVYRSRSVRIPNVAPTLAPRRDRLSTPVCKRSNRKDTNGTWCNPKTGSARQQRSLSNWPKTREGSRAIIITVGVTLLGVGYLSCKIIYFLNRFKNRCYHSYSRKCWRLVTQAPDTC